MRNGARYKALDENEKPPFYLHRARFGKSKMHGESLHFRSPLGGHRERGRERMGSPFGENTNSRFQRPAVVKV
ncbi:MAG: hypothetical protein ABI822_26775, partial [Bryobacteraceae bacterium]